jgi:hypothetical protein
MLTIASVKYHDRAGVLCAFSNGYAIGDGYMFMSVQAKSIETAKIKPSPSFSRQIRCPENEKYRHSILFELTISAR